MLDEDFDAEGWEENEDCGCVVGHTDVDGRQVEVHHWIPDDEALHVPDPACGCGPQTITNPDGVVLFEHWDQDIPDACRPPAGESSL